jgi:hypothetical protein
MISATCREHVECYVFITVADCFGGIEVFMTVTEFCLVLGGNGIYLGGTCQPLDVPTSSALSIVYCSIV